MTPANVQALYDAARVGFGLAMQGFDEANIFNQLRGFLIARMIGGKRRRRKLY